MIPHSKVHKRHNQLSYHHVCEAIASGIVRFYYVDRTTNPAIMLSKHWGYQKTWSCNPSCSGKEKPPTSWSNSHGVIRTPYEACECLCECLYMCALKSYIYDYITSEETLLQDIVNSRRTLRFGLSTMATVSEVICANRCAPSGRR